VSLPCCPSTKSVAVAGEEPSRCRWSRGGCRCRCRRRRLIWYEGARLPVAEKESLPPLALRVSFSLVPMSMENGAGLSRSSGRECRWR
jgi:hypothetical protein